MLEGRGLRWRLGVPDDSYLRLITKRSSFSTWRKARRSVRRTACIASLELMAKNTAQSMVR